MDEALRKLERAAKHIGELTQLLREKRPFRYVLQTDMQTGQRSTRPKKDIAVIADARDLASDAIQNLRTALDYAYYEIVRPFATTPKEVKAVQFPFSETAARLNEAVANRLADRVSPRFASAIVALAPHGEPGGDALLFAIHSLAAPDRHRFPVPTGDYTRVSADMLRSQITDLPSALGGEMSFGDNKGAHMLWTTPVDRIRRDTLGAIVPPTAHVFEQELAIPVEIRIKIAPSIESQPLIPTLDRMLSKANDVIRIIRAAK